jgi:hypothetical protein
MVKEINFFRWAAALGPEESERHYSEIHKVMARRMFRGAPAVHRYSPVRLVGRRDLTKAFGQRPDLWRYVLMQYAEEEYFLGPEVIERIWIDHRNCLEGIRNYRLEEEVLHDGLNGQTACTKFVLLVPVAIGDVIDSEWKSRLTESFAAAFGSRLLVFNRVLGSQGTEDEGRVITDDFSAETDLAAILELDFDNEEWGQEFLADPVVEDLLRLERADGTVAYQAEEDPGIDRR